VGQAGLTVNDGGCASTNHVPDAELVEPA
jgi:hypothetical protein